MKLITFRFPGDVTALEAGVLKRQLTDALADYVAAIRIDPRHGGAYLNKGVVHTERDEWDDALEAFETSARLGNRTGRGAPGRR